MRKLVVAFILGVLLSGSAFAQQPAEGDGPPWANKIFGGVLAKDFGTVAKGTKLKYSFRMTNIYKVPLQITDIRVTCGCVQAEGKGKLMQPGESTTLDITMNSGIFNGYKMVQCFVTVGPQFVSIAELKISATTRQDVVFNPGEVMFGVVQRGSTPSQFIDVEYAGALNWRVAEIVKNASAPFDLKVEELNRQPGAVQRVGYRIHATLKADAAPGAFSEVILLKTNDPASPTLSFNIIGNVQAPLTVVPSVVTMNSLKVGVSEETKVIVRGSQPFRITRIDGLGQGVYAVSDDKTTNTHFLTIRCQVDQALEMRKTLVIHTSLEKETVNLTVEVKAAP